MTSLPESFPPESLPVHRFDSVSRSEGARPSDPPEDRSDREHLDEMASELYDSLRKLACRASPGKAGRRLLDPTELVHESYLRLARSRALGRLRRTEFLALASHAIRNVLVDHARGQEALKRGGRMKRVTLDGHVLAPEDGVDLLHLDEALTKLARLDERQSRVVELRFFGGLTADETAQVLGVSRRTVNGDWAMAQAWLHRELSRMMK